MLSAAVANISKFIANKFDHSYALAAIGSSPIVLPSLKEILDGIVYATPKRRTPIRRILSRKYGDDNWKYGIKLWKPKRNIITCLECGSFYEVHTICRACFRKVRDESEKIIESIRGTWSRGIIDKEVQVLYHGESVPQNTLKRIVEQERIRPLWFASNLYQKSSNISQRLSSQPKELEDLTVREVTKDEKS